MGTIFDIRFGLSWQRQPDDLDLHLSGPDGHGGRFHLSWANRASPPVTYVSLDADHRQGYGPETIRLIPNPATGLFEVAQEYRLWANNRSRERQPSAAGWRQSQARVDVVSLVREADGSVTTLVGFNFAQWRAVGSDLAGIWYVTTITPNADGSGIAFQPVRLLQAGTSTSVL